MEFKADLHTHTTCSDGTLTPQELIALAKASNLSALSITDHDTTAAYPEALEFAEKAGIKLITGVEFSTVHKDNSIHILGYGIDPEQPDIKALCDWHSKRRKRRYLKILELLKEKGMPLDPEERMQYGRPHIAQSMIERGYVSSIPEAFHKWIGEGKPCFCREEWKSPEETIDCIHKGGGVAVIAHPHLIDKERTFQELLKMPIDGIECYYARFPIKHNSKFLRIARARNLLITAGSDFHGSVKPTNPLGGSWINKELFERLENALH